MINIGDDDSIRKEAKAFREKKIKEVWNNKNATPIEIGFIKRWAEMFNNKDLGDLIKQKYGE